MTPQRPYGRSTTGPVHNLPAVEFDFAEGQSLPAGMGKTEMPVRVLPEMVVDFQGAELVPTLQLTLSLREGDRPTAERLALDLFKLYTAVNQLELGAGGSGLALDETYCDGSGGEGEIRVCLKPTDPNGAEERLRHLVERINHSAAVAPASRFIERCEARIERRAA